MASNTAQPASENQAPQMVLSISLYQKDRLKYIPHHNLGCHDNGHKCASLPNSQVPRYIQAVEPGHHTQEGQQGEDDEELHALSVGGLAVFVVCLAENKRLVGIAECWGYHGHNHGYLDKSAYKC